MRRVPTPERFPESQRNALLRRVDWRFLLRQAGRPRVLNLASGGLGQAVCLVCDMPRNPSDKADLVVLASPRRAQLRRAHAALRSGGELYCEWRVPMPARTWKVRRALMRAGFEDIRLHWPGPRARRALPQFWMPLDSAAGVRHLLAARPAESRRDAMLRRVWQVAARAGALAPMSVVARRGGSCPAVEEVEEIDALIDGLADKGRVGDHPGSGRSLLLLTGGKRSINKVVGLPFCDSHPAPRLAVKFARVPEAEPGLAHEAHVLRALERDHAQLQGVPRVLAVGRRAGLLAVAETAILGSPLLSTLTPATFPRLAADVTRWLVELAATDSRQSCADCWPRLVQEPLDEFERRFGDIVDAGVVPLVRARLQVLKALPVVCEHRDCSPWNIVVRADGTPGLLDWESAERQGLPVLDLVYFLANAAFVMEGALENGRTREVYGRMLDPGTASGRVAAECLSEYAGQLGLNPALLPQLRLLCWIVHARSDFRHLEMDAAAAPAPGALRTSVFLGLLHEELLLGGDDV